MAREIRNNDSIIDSRDVIERLEELQEERNDLVNASDDMQQPLNDAHYELEAATDEDGVVHQDGLTYDLHDCLKTAQADYDESLDDLREWDEEYGDELKMLEKLNSEGEGYSADWTYGTTLIRDDYFERYARELAEDIGGIDRNASWPHNCIDWEQAARELQEDYTSVDFGGVDYWFR